MKKIWLPLCLTILLSACGGDFKLPPVAQSPVYIQIQSKSGILSSMPLTSSTVKTVVATRVADGRAALRFGLTDKGAKALYNITSSNIGNTMQVFWQDNIISSVTIESPMGGSTMGLVLVLPDSTPNEINGIIDSIQASDPNAIDQ